MKLYITRFILFLLLVAPLALADDREEVNETRPVTANERINLDVMSGEVRIRAASDNTFSVSGLLDENAEGFTLTSGGGFTRFKVDMPRTLLRNSNNANGSDLVITIPAGSNIEFKGVNVKVDVEGIQGGSRITTVNGDIEARALRDIVSLNTVNGAITSQDISGRLDISTVNGQISDRGSIGRTSYDAVNGRISIESSAEEVSISVFNGGIEATLDGARLIEFKSVNGNIDVDVRNSATPRINGNTLNGSFRLTLDRDVSARFILSNTLGGSINNTLTDDEPVSPRFGPGSRLEFSTGDGAGVVEFTSLSGRIDVRGR